MFVIICMNSQFTKAIKDFSLHDIMLYMHSYSSFNILDSSAWPILSSSVRDVSVYKKNC